MVHSHRQEVKKHSVLKPLPLPHTQYTLCYKEGLMMAAAAQVSAIVQSNISEQQQLKIQPEKIFTLQSCSNVSILHS